MRRVAVLGSTGSIGVSTLDVLARHRDRFVVAALAARSSVDRMEAQCRAWRPARAVLVDPEAAAELKRRLAGEGIEVLAGEGALAEVATLPEVDTVVAGVVGAAGLDSTLAAVAAGKRVLLANKEALVMAGPLLMESAARHGATLLPIDSEHNAVFQCLPPGFRPGLEDAGVARITLTASGGPFREADPATLAGVTPEQACAHPNWDMGPKISVDSATMMNKGLELIEAHWLFGVPRERLQVVIHPQSIVHSMVAYADGSVLAQLGNPDMRTPIAHALAWPERIEAGVEPLDLVAVSRLDFEAPDLERFPCLGLAYRALEEGGTAGAVLNAANEVAVDAFLAGRLGFPGIPEVIARTMARLPAREAADLESILEADRRAREVARSVIAGSHEGEQR